MVTKTRRATGYKNTWLQKERKREKREMVTKTGIERFGYKNKEREMVTKTKREMVTKRGI